MNPTDGTNRQDVEALVREVLARIESLSVAPQQKQEKAPKAADEHFVAGKVISVRSFDASLAGARRIVIEAGAIVTPAARDLLREKKIEVVRGQRQKQTSGRKLTIGATTSLDSAELMRFARGVGAEVYETPRVGLAGVVAEVVDRVGGSGELGLLLTGDVAAAVCLANRRSGVRCASAANVAELRRAIESLKVNLLVVDPASCSRPATQEMLKQFLSLGGGPAPAALAALLN